MSKVTIKEVNDFYTCETIYMFNKILEGFEDESYSPRGVFLEVINFLYDENLPPSHAEIMSDEVKGHFTKIAYLEYQKSNNADFEKSLRLHMQNRLEFLYREYYESTLSVTAFQDNGERIRKEIEELKIKLGINS